MPRPARLPEAALDMLLLAVLFSKTCDYGIARWKDRPSNWKVNIALK